MKVVPGAIAGIPDDDMVIGKLRIVPSARGAFLGGNTLSLTPVEYEILLSLARASGPAIEAEAEDMEFSNF